MKRRRRPPGSSLGSPPEEHARNAETARKEILRLSRMVVGAARNRSCMVAFHALNALNDWQGVYKAEFGGAGGRNRLGTKSGEKAFDAGVKAEGAFRTNCIRTDRLIRSKRKAR